jgi:uncharacterized membrane protein
VQHRYFRFVPLAAALFAAPALLAQEYTFERFFFPGASTTAAKAINNRGAIIGQCYGSRSGQFFGGNFKRDANGVFEFPIRVGAGTSVSGINDLGEIVGFYSGASAYRGFLLTGGIHGTVTTIDVPPGPHTLIWGVNNLGDFAGSTGGDQVRQQHAFVSIGGVITQFDFPGASATRATAIAWDGTVVGFYFTDTTVQSSARGFVRGPKGNFYAFDAGGTETYPAGINNVTGLIVGHYFDGRPAGPDRNYGFVYDYLADLQSLNGATSPTVRKVPAQTVTLPDHLDTYLTGVNADGVIVGWADKGTATVVSFTATRRR